jgi:hypothetical protein
LCLIEAPGMPGGPTHEAGLWLEVKGLESLGVCIGGCPSHPGWWNTGTLGSWAAGILIKLRRRWNQRHAPGIPQFHPTRFTPVPLSAKTPHDQRIAELASRAPRIEARPVSNSMRREPSYLEERSLILRLPLPTARPEPSSAPWLSRPL